MPGKHQRLGGVRQFEKRQAKASDDGISEPAPKHRKLSTSCDNAPNPLDINTYQLHLKNLFIRSRTSGVELAEGASIAEAAGARGGETFAENGNHPLQRGITSRGLRRQLSASASIPEHYWAAIPSYDPITDTDIE